MSQISEYSLRAERSLAAYATLPTGVPNEINLQDDGRAMTATQAATLAAKWSVVTQYTDPVTGLSAAN